MSRILKRISNPSIKAEGLIYLNEINQTFPYHTELAGPNGCCIHIWMGEENQNKGLLYRLYRLASNYRDVIQCTYSNGTSEGIWPDPINMYEDEYLHP